MKTYKSYSKAYSLTIQERDSEYHKIKITRSKDAANFAWQFYHEDINIYESVFMIMLNRANNTIGHVKISQGGISGTVIDPKIVAKYAIDSLCSSVIMVHNHPSGNSTPSNADIQITSKIKKGLLLLDIEVLDHIVLSEIAYTSMADEGLMY